MGKKVQLNRICESAEPNLENGEIADYSYSTKHFNFLLDEKIVKRKGRETKKERKRRQKALGGSCECLRQDQDI